MKKVDASRPGLGFPARLGILTLILSGGVFATLTVVAKRRGTDAGVYLTKIDYRRTYSKENFNYSVAETKLKLGDRKGCAALVKTLAFGSDDDGKRYQALRLRLVKAQLAAGELTEALLSAAGDTSLAEEVLLKQLQRQGAKVALAGVSQLPPSDQPPLYRTLALHQLAQGDTSGAEETIARLPEPHQRRELTPALADTYYKKRELARAIAVLEGLPTKPEQSAALVVLGRACLRARDMMSLRVILERLPSEANGRQPRMVSRPLTPAPRFQLLTELIASSESPNTILELMQAYAHPDDLPTLVHTVSSNAINTRNRQAALAALQLLHSLPSEAAKRLYDQEASQIFYNALDLVPDPLELVLGIHDERVRGATLQQLGLQWVQQNNWQGLDRLFRGLGPIPKPELQRVYDSLSATASARLRISDPARARQYAEQIVDPQQRQSALSILPLRTVPSAPSTLEGSQPPLEGQSLHR
ncbi:hypothetical protein [Armatimonas rosea]|uniref:Uncharacterized protein n=1 Tax=Armatimonas rosea TaxID=685828 RepID=A0A7W9W8P8_ARMRO|nr:hypothetical protein [Armatimonas rosea]MBB6053809.1 hypothetical protein [Armatimonas rosea]